MLFGNTFHCFTQTSFANLKKNCFNVVACVEPFQVFGSFFDENGKLRVITLRCQWFSLLNKIT